MSVVFETERSYMWLYPLMWVLAFWAALKKKFTKVVGLKPPRVNSLFFDGLGPVCKSIKEGAASWRALNLIYNYHFPKPKRFADWLDNVWLKSPNAQAVRNRHKIATAELSKTIRHMYELYGEVRILSLAAGSAEGVLLAVAKARESGLPVQCLLVDHNERAMEYAQQVAASLGIGDCVSVEVASVTSIVKIRGFVEKFQPQIVEMMGLLDYLSDTKAACLIRTIHHGLPPAGRFFTCNIMPNPEQYFLKYVLDWGMIYRTEEDLHHLFIRAGFEEIQILTEPLQIHSIVCGRRAEILQDFQVATLAKTFDVVQ